MNEMPPLALVEDWGSKARFVSVEAPPCGNRLDLDEHGVHLSCDQPKGHEGRHRQVLAPDHPVYWCDDDCAHRCSGPLSALAKLRGK
jgi:hypothetical protein